MPSGSSPSGSECGDLGRRGCHLLGFGVLLFICTLSFGGGGLQRVRNLPFGVIERSGPPWLLVRMTEHLPLMSSVSWSLLAGQPVPRLARWQSPIWWLSSCQELLSEILLTTLSLVVEGEGFRTFEDTGLRCVVSGTLVWVTGVDSRKVTVRPTNREIGSVFAGQTDGLQGEALGSALVVFICAHVPQPSWQSRAFTSSRAGLFKVGSTPEIYLVFVLVCMASSHMTFGLMEDQCIRSLPHHSLTPWRLPDPRQA